MKIQCRFLSVLATVLQCTGAFRVGPTPRCLLAVSSTPSVQPELAELAVKDCMRGALSADGQVSAKAIVTSTLVRGVTARQGYLPIAAAALGRAMTCSLLIADGLKDQETFQVRFQGDGPLNGVLAIANGECEAKGMVGNPKVTLPPNANGKLDVGGGVGAGLLYVVRAKMLPGDPGPSPYSSITEIRSGEIPEDINFYLAESEQREGALAAGVHVDGSGVVDAAGGWSVALLPGATDEVAEKLMANLEAMKELSPTTMVLKGMGPDQVLELILKDMGPITFFEPKTPKPTPNCCSEKKVLATLQLLPIREVAQIVEQNEVIEVKCEFCGTVRTLEHESIREQLDRRILAEVGGAVMKK